MSSRNDKIIEAVSLSVGRRKEGDRILQRVFSILLFSVFVVVDLLALVAGTSAYGSITKMQSENDQRVMTLGPITSSIRANDVEGGVRLAKNGPEGRALVLAQTDEETGDVYETRIYLHQGSIVQEYALGGSAYTPERATTLATSSTFEFDYEDGGLLTIQTDAGVAKIALRNMQGGA